ncbi:MAG: hypothetical protein QF408_05780 [Pirellulales bacterium]|jgi:hypothetical protein|nr:hypothetical protein [Pirellulales bacterium]HJN67304.1 hypothetical protein [Pirellulales bacterium]
METSLHRDLKLHYADEQTRLEVQVDNFRIDALAGDWLVEIQHSSLSAIRAKVKKLLKKHQVLIVKPLVQTKQLIKRAKKGGRVIDRRKSPKRAGWLDIFEELLYFTHVFPHPQLAIEIVMVDAEEWRYPGHGRRRRWRKTDFIVEDQKLVEVHGAIRIQNGTDLWQLLGKVDLPQPFHTGDLADQLGIDRTTAQRIAYVLRNTFAIEQVGKKGNALLYAHTVQPPAEVA